VPEFLRIVEFVLGAAGLIAAMRLVRGPTVADRMLALDLVLAMVGALAAVEAARTESEYLVPLLVVLTLVAFIGTVIVARYIERRDL
jgi:multicomponent Na+:H+ antiporter subunit F